MIQPLPRPAALAHLRPADGLGLAAVTAAISSTGAGIALACDGALLGWLVGQLLLATAFLQWFALLHECGHGTLFRTRRWNAAAGELAGLFALIPYAAWTRIHASHHRWTGWQDLDPTTQVLTPRERSRSESAAVNFCWKYWIPLFAVLYRTGNYWNLARLARLFPEPAARRAVALDAALLGSSYLGLVAWIGVSGLVRGAGLALVLCLMAQDVLLLSQHTHIPQRLSRGEPVKPFSALEQQPFTRSLRLPRVFSVLLLHLDAHELHHMYPFVPGYWLARIPYASPNEVGALGWIRRARRVPGEIFLFQSRAESGWQI